MHELWQRAHNVLTRNCNHWEDGYLGRNHICFLSLDNMVLSPCFIARRVHVHVEKVRATEMVFFYKRGVFGILHGGWWARMSREDFSFRRHPNKRGLTKVASAMRKTPSTHALGIPLNRAFSRSQAHLWLQWAKSGQRMYQDSLLLTLV
jgi:hypothetical protein